MTEVAALQAAVAAEHAVVYGYGVAGAHLSGADRAYALASLQVQQSRRDQLMALVVAAHATPVAALPAYQLPLRVTDGSSARDLAARLETAAAGSAWDLVAAAAPGSSARALGIAWLTDAARRAGHWGVRRSLPGQPG